MYQGNQGWGQPLACSAGYTSKWSRTHRASQVCGQPMVAHKLLLCIVELVHLQLVVEVPNLVQSVLHGLTCLLHALASSAPGCRLVPSLLATQHAVRIHKATVTSSRKDAQTVQQTLVVHRDAQLPSHFVDAPAVWP